MSIMPSYHEIDGVPSHKSKWLLQDVLRGEWKFDGTIVSDYYGIEQLIDRHRTAADVREAARQSLEAGVDIELPDLKAYATLLPAIKNGTAPAELLDSAVARTLRHKFLLGLFENPYVDEERAVRVTNNEAHQALAAEAARQSITLLKNDGNLLPLDKTKLKSIAVVGPNAARAHLGGYTDPTPPASVSILDGVRRKVGANVKINYAEGCKITKQGGDWWADKAEPGDESEDRRLIAEAVEVVRKSDVALVVVGGNEDTNKEAWADNHIGDRDSLELVGRQNDLVRAVVETGKPVVVFLIGGSPLAINYIRDNVPAILGGFYLGQETGTGAADVLFGDFNPSGKLPVSFARSVGQLPIYYNHKPSAKRGYVFASKDPLFPFGHGLSYTIFNYKNLRLSANDIAADAETTASVDVTNTGGRAGAEVVQLYFRDEVSSVTRPVKELKDFARVELKPGETKIVRFRITPDKLAFLDASMKTVVEPGEFRIMVGTSSVKHDAVTLRVAGNRAAGFAKR